MDKHKLEEWIRYLSNLHSCIGLGLEEKSHPRCRKILHLIADDINETIAGLEEKR